MRSKNNWLKKYPMINYKKADCKKISNSVREKLSEQKGEVIYMKRSFKPIAIIGAVLAVSFLSVFTVNAATDGAVVDKIKEWKQNITVYINGKKVEMPVKIKQIGDDYIGYEIEIDDENSGGGYIEFSEEGIPNGFTEEENTEN